MRGGGSEKVRMKGKVFMGTYLAYDSGEVGMRRQEGDEGGELARRTAGRRHRWTGTHRMGSQP